MFTQKWTFCHYLLLDLIQVIPNSYAVILSPKKENYYKKSSRYDMRVFK